MIVPPQTHILLFHWRSLSCNNDAARNLCCD